MPLTIDESEVEAASATVRQPCAHQPGCPSPDSPDRDAACCVASHPEQGWTLLCNGVVCFEDTGELLPDGRVVAPHRPTDPPRSRQM